MNLNFKISLLVFSVPILISSRSDNKPIIANDNELNLIDKGRKIENYISFYTSESNYENIKAVDGQKIAVKSATLVINGDTLNPERIRTHGKSTLYFRRKSFSFSLKSEATFRHGEKTESFKKFFVLSLAMDRNYSSNRLAFELMEKIKLFHLFYSFCELRINGQSEGVCMVIERPEDWAIKKKKSPFLIRRGYDENIEKIESGKTTEKAETKKFSYCYHQIYKSLNKYKGEELYKTLSTWLDMDNYFKWLALNFFVRNGDYTDEVYLYIDRSTNKFNIIPWDYDDLFAIVPHEGKVESRKALGDKLIFSSEDLLDKKIASDPYLYKLYLIQLRSVLTMLSPDTLKSAFETTYAELYPYYSKKEIISMSKYDSHKDTNLEKLKNDMTVLYNQLILSRAYYLKYIEVII
jgi:spore coat protein H